MTIALKYNKFLFTQMNGGADTTGGATAGAARVVDFDTDTIKVALVTNAYVPSATAHAVKAAVGANEVTGTGYTAGGKTLTGVTVTEAGGVVTFKADDVTFLQNASGFANARYAIIYKDTGNALTSTIITGFNFEADKGNVAGDLILQFNAGGITTWTN